MMAANAVANLLTTVGTMTNHPEHPEAVEEGVSIMRRVSHLIVGIVCMASVVAGVALGANKKAPERPPLSEEGQALEAKFSTYLETMKSKLEGALPALSEADKADFKKALAAEAAARGRVDKVQSDIAHLNWARNMFARAKDVTLVEADKGIADCKAKEAAASSAAERMSAQKKCEVWEQKRAKAEKEIGYFGKKIETLTPREPQYKKDLAATQSAYEKARSEVMAVAERTGVEKVLSSSALDGELAKYVIIQEATPYGLADFAQKGKTQQALLAKLLTNKELMVQIAVADGAQKAKYGRAMEIYTAIQKASTKARDGVLQRLALAVALAHAVPIAQRNAVAQTDAPAVVDPLKRYRYYEKAYLDGELDPAFKDLTTFDLRMVVCGEEPNEISTWGRETLRNFRPDHVMHPDQSWRYVGIVASDVKYGSGDNKYDRDELQFFQNILMNGGICGRRAFFGRFMLRAWGIPSIKRPSRGHAALARWSPKGWAVCLGPRWGGGKAGAYGRYWRDVDFLATTQGRSSREAFMRVKRAYWAGAVYGETLSYNSADKNPSFWSRVALRTQQAIIEESKAVTLAAVGANLGEGDAHEKGTGKVETAEKITRGPDGSMTIPAALHIPLSNDILTMKSFAGGYQVFLPRFFHEGKTIMRGSAWKGSPDGCASGARLLSDGYGVYEDWGLRAAMSASGDHAPATMTLDLGPSTELGTGKRLTMEMVYIKPGTFVMGGVNDKDGRFKCVELPKHEVQITKGYYLGKYEVTQAQFEAIMGYNPSRSTKGPDCPVDNIPQTDAAKFCDLVAAKSGQDVRLPTEAEWEYACRAGSSTRWFCGDDPAALGDYAWFKGNAEKKSHPVGQKKPNAWGLYDMHGNVCERIADVYATDFYAKSPKQDPFCFGQSDRGVFDVTVNAAQAGTYKLTAKVVTVNYDQRIMVAANDAETATVMNLPFTGGTWQDASPVEVELKQGENTLHFWRTKPPQRGVAVKSFALTPAP